jgi:hypothetical protein
MYVVERLVDGEWCFWGSFSDKHKACEVANWFTTEFGIPSRVVIE